ncbi:M48 family metallopeptidase [Chthonobacter rhizosphaerae]|uniref:M48 family metallopeptidase n=1 Tax=Chthonobacter rhizosphaerae TaxID=2735553 RepID=UPI0015EF4583|nr:M48 family metallopeptidase [Chthonobacter rhizosphaerae]
MCACNRPHSALTPCLASRGPSRRAVLGFLAAGAASPMLAGCEQVASLVVSDEAVAELGAETWARLKAAKPPTRSAAAQRTAEEVALRLLRATGEDPRGWEVQVFAEPTVNAFALPGRKIGIFEGMLEVSGGGGGLAAVVGHEIGHVVAAHPAERITAEMARQWGLQLIAFLLEINDVAFAREIAGLLGVGAEFGFVRPYGRRQEREADRLGVFMMARAGYDPREAVALWRRMDAMGGAGLPAFLSTHPAPAARAEEIEGLIPEAIEAARG